MSLGIFEDGAVTGIFSIGNAFARGGSLNNAKFFNAVKGPGGYSYTTTINAAGRTLKTAMHGMAGGARSVLSGGTFKAGFASAGFTQAAAPAIAYAPGGSIGQITAAGVVGGTGSRLAGGSFEDGFVTGVFSRAFNECLHGGCKGQVYERTYKGTATHTEEHYVSNMALGDIFATGLEFLGSRLQIPWLTRAGWALEALDVGTLNTTWRYSYQTKEFDKYTLDTYYENIDGFPGAEIPYSRHNSRFSNPESRIIPGTGVRSKNIEICIYRNTGCF